METPRESIFVSSIRGFCRSMFLVFGLFFGLFLCFSLFSAFTSSTTPAKKTTLEILPDLEGRRSLAPLSSPVVLRINIHGVIGDLGKAPPHVSSTNIQNILLESREDLLQSDRVKAILLHFNTPGGSAIDSDTIYRLFMTYKERYHVPIFGYVEGLCASGGMYIASAADRIFCGPAGIVGSIGVVSNPFFNVTEALTKFGIQSKTIIEGLDKDAMNPFRPWKPDEDANLKELMASLYTQFVDIVTTARPRLDKTKLIHEYGAKIFDGVRAQQYGYVDFANSSYETALLALMQEAHIDSSQPYQIVELQTRHTLLTELISGKSPLFSGILEHRIQMAPENQERFAYIYQ